MAYLLQAPEVVVIPLQSINRTNSNQYADEEKERKEAYEHLRTPIENSTGIRIPRDIDPELVRGLGTYIKRSMQDEIMLENSSAESKLGPKYQVIQIH